MSSMFAMEMDETDSDDSRPLRELDRLAGGTCTDCRFCYSSREAVFSIVLGFKNAPRCLVCLSRRLSRMADELRGQLVDHIHRRDCFLKAWREAERRDAAATFDNTRAVTVPELPGNMIPTVTGEWDAGDMSCGELVMALRLRMTDLSSGAVLKVTATDPAAPEDLPAWCRMSGHALVAMNHPDYYIRRKGD